MTRKISYLYAVLFGLAAVLSSCHAKKAVLRGEPGEVVKPKASIAEKYSAILGVDEGDIKNGRLYTFV
ncbi:MAG: glycoside hydrolase, partial [Sphingobacteriales bacterium]